MLFIRVGTRLVSFILLKIEKAKIPNSKQQIVSVDMNVVQGIGKSKTVFFIVGQSMAEEML